MIPFPKPRQIQITGYSVHCPKDGQLLKADSVGRLQQGFRLHVTLKHREQPDFSEAPQPPRAKVRGKRRQPRKAARKIAKALSADFRGLKHKRASDLAKIPHTEPLKAAAPALSS